MGCLVYLMVIESVLVAEVCGETEVLVSTTSTTNVLVPAAVALPDITPVELRVNPAGSFPDLRDHL